MRQGEQVYDGWFESFKGFWRGSWLIPGPAVMKTGSSDLCVRKGALAGELSAVARNWLALGGGQPSRGSKAQGSKHQNAENQKA